MNPHANELSAYLWDLRSHAESKLRCLTKVQQLLSSYMSSDEGTARTALRATIVTNLTDVVDISKALRSVSDEALVAAHALP